MTKENREGNTNPPFLTLKEAAAFINLAPSTVYKLTSKGDLPHYKRGNRLYFDRQELINWIKEGWSHDKV